jgi:hypothetical protein
LAPKLKAQDPKKPNDKSNSSLGSYKQPSGKMILLTVKVTEQMKNQMQGFERAWYRLVNGDTS